MIQRLAITIATLVGILLALTVGATASLAQNTIENLVMPGELATPHMKLEADCSSCHTAFKKAVQSTLCADCHKPIKQDIAAGKGFHGRNAQVKVSACAGCHADHQGRDFKMAPLASVVFDHAQTDFELQGAHGRVSCGECHATGKKFAEAPHACFDCHKTDQPHLGNLGEKCGSCHGTETWNRTKVFDHGKTSFALKGAHAKVACMSCHVGEVYEDLPSTCASCHAIQDVHAGRFGAECASCHSVEKWRPASFDHDKLTSFPLAGAHAKATCASCHGSDVTRKISANCFECHREQDVHKAQLGAACGDCHKTVAWRKNVTFDHSLTSFPLTGLHTVVACESCHQSAAFKDAKADCFSCHQTNDVHLGRFTSACESCHTAATWTAVSFDHGKNTQFPLTGVHAKLGCNSCHTAQHVTSARLPMTCFDCHKQQDIHRGAFGRNCASCHSTATFKKAVIGK